MHRFLSHHATLLLGCALAVTCVVASRPTVAGECPDQQIANFEGPGQVTCPCFIQGEEAGSVFSTIPAGDFPIEILRVGIGWGSQFGGAPQSLEQAVHIYASGLPDPGVPIASILGPVLTDGFINEFDFEPQPGEIVVGASPVSATLQFLNTNAGNIFAPSVVHDGIGCQPGANLVRAIPGGWIDACQAGVTGDWIFYVIYKQVNCGTTGIDDLGIASNVPAALLGARPNPVLAQSQIEFFLDHEDHVELSVYDLQGRKVVTLADRQFAGGRHTVAWDARNDAGARVASGIYFVDMRAGRFNATQKIVVGR